MQVSSAVSAPPPTGGAIIQVLQAALQTQTQLAEELLQVQAETQVALQEMAVAGQIVDTYA